MSQREMPPTVDRISALPDEVLCHILSFLPTKLAFATSVLSKRWKPLWRSVPTLHLDDERVQEEKTYLRFGRFVKAVTRSRDLHQPITRFRLKCRSELCARFNVNKWVKSAIRRRVEHLELSLPSVINLAPRILSCQTLVVLKLSRLTVSAVSSVDFPSLKILRLNKVHFQEHRYVKELLSGCPILEDLQTIDLPFDQHVTKGGYKSLPKLVRADISTFDVPFSAISNVEFLRIDMMDVLSDDQAINTYYKDIPLFHNLISVELRFFDSPGWDQVVEVLEHCPKLQILVVEKRKSDSLFYGANWVYPKCVPECLSLHLRTCSLGNYGGWQGELRFATYIMQNARLLQIMTIRSASSSNPMQKLEILKELSSCPRISPTCKLLFECK